MVSCLCWCLNLCETHHESNIKMKCSKNLKHEIFQIEVYAVTVKLTLVRPLAARVAVFYDLHRPPTGYHNDNNKV